MNYQQPGNLNNPNSSNHNSDFSAEKRKFFKRLAIFTIITIGILTIVAAAVFFILAGNKSFNKRKQLQETGNLNKASVELSYFHSIADNAEMALAGAHEFGIRGNYLYITSVKDHGLEVMDISDPGNPKHISAFFDNEETFMKKPHSIVFKDNYAYVSATEDGAIQVFDISNPTDPRPVSYLKDDEEIGLKGVHGIAINSYYLYAAGTKDNALEIIDISDPREIKHAAVIFDNKETSLKGPHSIAFKDNYAYIITAEEGIEVIDISNPVNPAHVSSYTENDHGHKFGGGHDIIIRGKDLFTASYVDGLGFFDITDPAKIKFVSEIHPSEENGLMSASDLALSGNNLFAVSEASGALVMADISDIGKPVLKSIIRDDGSGTMFLWNAHYVGTAGDYVYTAGLENGFGIVKIIK